MEKHFVHSYLNEKWNICSRIIRKCLHDRYFIASKLTCKIISITWLNGNVIGFRMTIDHYSIFSISGISQNNTLLVITQKRCSIAYKHTSESSNSFSFGTQYNQGTQSSHMVFFTIFMDMIEYYHSLFLWWLADWTFFSNINLSVFFYCPPSFAFSLVLCC